jgi:hypothetical protein
MKVQRLLGKVSGSKPHGIASFDPGSWQRNNLGLGLGCTRVRLR